VVAVGRRGELGLDDGAGDGDGMVLLDVQAACDGGCDVGRDIEPVICAV
jgi:hypothetical protein